MNTFKPIFAALVLFLFQAIFLACSDDKENTIIPPENSIPGQEFGIRQLTVKLPRLGRLEILFSKINCRIHIKGVDDRITYPVNTFLSATADSLIIEAEDPILSELPHQMYHLNYITFPKKDLAVKSAEVTAEAGIQDTVYLGARLSVEDPDNIVFRSSFNLEADRIGVGSTADPIAIACGKDFYDIICSELSVGNDLADKCFELTANINFQMPEITTDKGWQPAGRHNINGSSTSFNGMIDGNGNAIDLLSSSSTEDYAGLFYKLGSRAHVHDIEFTSVALNGKDYIGAVACYSEEGAQLENISLTGFIDGVSNIGGLVGSGDVTVTNCVSSLAVKVKSDKSASNIGGLIGFTTSSEIKNCILTGLVTAPKGKNVGGITGAGGSFTNCYVGGSIEGYDYTGGITGMAGGTFAGCRVGATMSYNSYAFPWEVFLTQPLVTPFSISIIGHNYVGGFAGGGSLTLEGENIFMRESGTTATLTGNDYVGGLVGHSKSLEARASASYTSYAHIKAHDYSGGVAGRLENMNTDAIFTNRGSINATGYHCGGIVGWGTALACKGTWTNEATIVGVRAVGGIIGDVDKMDSQCEIHMINDGSVTSTNYYLGGLVGYSNSQLNFGENSRVSHEGGSMKITGEYYVGGVIGSLEMEVGSKSYIINKQPAVHANIYARSYVGGISGYMRLRNATGVTGVINGTNTCKIVITSSSTSGTCVGGAIGFMRAETNTDNVGQIKLSGITQLTGSITAAGGAVGGIVGRLENNKNKSVLIEDCKNFVNLTSTATSNVDGFGGIGGLREELGYEIRISRCANYADISGRNVSAAGGIFGQQEENVYIDQCFNVGKVDANSAVGGILGRAFDGTTVENCFNMGEVPWVSGKTLLAGIVGQKENKSKKDLLIKNCYNVGTTGWGIIGGEDDKNVDCQNCYYLDTASNGDMKKSGSVSKNATQMRQKGTYSGYSTDIWLFGTDGQGAPTLKNNKIASGYPNPLSQ